MSYDVDTIHAGMLENISDTYQKTEGFPTYDLTRAVAMAIKSLGDDVDTAMEKSDVDKMTGDELTKWCYQRKGVSRKPAAAATGLVKIVTGNGSIAAGDLFESVGGVQFSAAESKAVSAGTTVSVKAVVSGADGNVAAGSVTLMPVTLAGISSVTNEAAMFGGYDAETDESLRSRYYQAVVAPSTSGNKNQYIEWAMSVTGVGAAKCYPLDDGDNTVGICIIDSTMQPANTTLVSAVQNFIDPESAGEGTGTAPIGAYCTVYAATGVYINVACTVTLASGYNAATVLENVKVGIKEYLDSIAFSGSYVSYAKIANAVIDAAGVLDYTGLTVNSGTANITIADKSVPVMGTVTIA